MIQCDFCQMDVDEIIFEDHYSSHPSKILDWLYLGSLNNASNKKELKLIDIKYILNCADECKNYFPKDFTYKNLHLYVSKIELN